MVCFMKINKIHRLSNTTKITSNCNYLSAHDGNLLSALRLVDDIIKDYSHFASLSVHVCPVIKTSGNKIPLALAMRIVQNSKSVLCDTIFLSNDRPGTKMIDRMFYQPEFYGTVMPGKYILVDDVFTTGITLKSLKTFIENNAGQVSAAYTMGSSKSTLFELSTLQLKILSCRFPDLSNYFDPTELTIVQMEYLLKFSSLQNLNSRYSENHFNRQFC